MIEYNEKPRCAKFNPGTTVERKIFLEKTRALPEDKRLDLTVSNATKIMEILQLKEASMGKIITAIPTSWTAGVVGNLKNLLSQSPSISLERMQREAHCHNATEIAETDQISSLS